MQVRSEVLSTHNTCLWADVEGKQVTIAKRTEKVRNTLKLCKQDIPGNDLQQHQTSHLAHMLSYLSFEPDRCTLRYEPKHCNKMLPLMQLESGVFRQFCSSWLTKLIIQMQVCNTV